MANKERTERCAVCQRGAAHERSVERAFAPFGRREVYTVREWFCDVCGETYHDDAQTTANEPDEAAARARAFAHVGGEQLRYVREQAGLSQAELERRLGFGRNVVARWEIGLRELPGYVATIVRMVGLRPALVHQLAELEPAAPAPLSVRERPAPSARLGRRTAAR